MKEIKERRSIRKYLAKDVPQGVLVSILENARLAPSGSNTQPWRFLVVRDETARQRIMMADHQQKWMMTAPIFLVCAADIRSRSEAPGLGALREDSKNPDIKLIIRDSAIAIEHIVLEAQHQGISTCWTAWFAQEEMQWAVNAPVGYYIAAVVTLGYAAEQPDKRARKALEDIVSYESW
jgi:nitroreductase